MAKLLNGIVVVAALVIVFIISMNAPTEKVSPSDIICQTIAHCNVGNVTYNIGDAVSSPKYSYGFKTGQIIVMNVSDKTALIKWDNGESTTENLFDLNKLKIIG